MKLLVSELMNHPLKQVIVTKRNTNVEAIRINLYKHRFPAGTLKVKIHVLSGELMSSSTTVVEASEISSSDFFHGFVTFYIKANLMKGTGYIIVLEASDYTFSEESYFGWCSSFDLKAYPPSYSPNSGIKAPLSLEIWERK